MIKLLDAALFYNIGRHGNVGKCKQPWQYFFKSLKVVPMYLKNIEDWIGWNHVKYYFNLLKSIGNKKNLFKACKWNVLHKTGRETWHPCLTPACSSNHSVLSSPTNPAPSTVWHIPFTTRHLTSYTFPPQPFPQPNSQQGNTSVVE